MTKARKIDCHYLVYCESKPVMLTPDKTKADALVHLIKTKNKTANYKPINGTEDRLKEIGKNLFERTKSMSESEIQNVLGTRNKLILEWMNYKKEKDVSDDVAWAKIAKIHNIYSIFKTMEDYNQWSFDVINYYEVNR